MTNELTEISRSVEKWLAWLFGVNTESHIYTPGLYRILHDNEKPVLPPRAKGWKPGKALRGLPETCRLNGGKKGNIVLSPAAVAYVKRINTPKAWVYVQKPRSGWLNQGRWPQIEQLTFGGNYVEVYEIQGNRAYVRTFFNNQQFPKGVEDLTLVQRFGVVYNDGHWASGTDTQAGMVLTLLIANPGEKLWIDISNITKVATSLENE